MKKINTEIEKRSRKIKKEMVRSHLINLVHVVRFQILEDKGDDTHVVVLGCTMQDTQSLLRRSRSTGSTRSLQDDGFRYSIPA